MLFAIGAGDQVIAVDDQSNFPAEAAARRPDLSGFEPNVEAIAALEPDLVVIHDGTPTSRRSSTRSASRSGRSGGEDFDDIYAQIEQLGAITGHVAEAAELVVQMQTDIDTHRRGRREARRRR